jgi:HEAT repeat protein
MKRFLLFSFLFLLLAGISVGGYFAVKYTRNRILVPISVDEMTKLQEKGDQAAPAIPRLIECFDRDNEELRLTAAMTLGTIGAKAVEPVRERLKDGNAKVRFCAVESLAFIGPDAAPASDDLLACLKDDDEQVRRKAAYALGRVGVTSDKTILGLLGALSDSSPEVVAAAQESLKQMGAPPKEAVPTLAKLAKDENQQVRTLALKLLGQVGEPAVPVFKEMLKNPDALDTVALVKAIAPLGPLAKPLLPELQEIMTKSKWWDAESEMLAVFKKNGEDGAKALTNILGSLHDPKSPHFDLADDRSRVVVKAIGEMGSTGRVAVPKLIEMLKERPSLRPVILEAFGDIGPAARDAQTPVEALLKEPAYREQARIALNRIGIVQGK